MNEKKDEGFFSPDNIATSSNNPPQGKNISILNVFKCSEKVVKYVYAQNNSQYTGFKPEILDKTLLYHKSIISPTSKSKVNLYEASKCEDPDFFQLSDYISYEKNFSNSFLVTNLSSSLPKCGKIGAYNIAEWKEENLDADKLMMNELKNCVDDIRSYVAKKIVCKFCVFKDSPAYLKSEEFDTKLESFVGFNIKSPETSNIPIFLVVFNFKQIKNDVFDILPSMQKIINEFFGIYHTKLKKVESRFTYLTTKVPEFKDLQENFQFLNFEKNNYKVKYMVGNQIITKLTMLSQINELPQNDKYISCVKALTFSGDKEDNTIQYPITYSDENSQPEVFMNILVPALGENNFSFFFRKSTDDSSEEIEKSEIDPYFKQNFRETQVLCGGTKKGGNLPSNDEKSKTQTLKKYKLYGQKYFHLLATSYSYGSNNKIRGSNAPPPKEYLNEVRDFGLTDPGEPLVKSYFSPAIHSLIYVQFKISKKHPAFFDDGLDFQGFDYLIESNFLPTYPIPTYYPALPIDKIKTNSCIDASIAPAYLGSFFSTYCIRDSKNSIVYVSYRIFVRRDYQIGTHFKEICGSNLKLFAISDRKSLTIENIEEIDF